MAHENALCLLIREIFYSCIWFILPYNMWNLGKYPYTLSLQHLGELTHTCRFIFRSVNSSQIYLVNVLTKRYKQISSPNISWYSLCSFFSWAVHWLRRMRWDQQIATPNIFWYAVCTFFAWAVQWFQLTCHVFSQFMKKRKRINIVLTFSITKFVYTGSQNYIFSVTFQTKFSFGMRRKRGDISKCDLF